MSRTRKSKAVLPSRHTRQAQRHVHKQRRMAAREALAAGRLDDTPVGKVREAKHVRWDYW